MTDQQLALQKNENQLTRSERFTQKIIAEFGGGVSAPQLTSYQRQLVEGYFIAIDRALKTAEETRERKNKSNKDHSYDNSLPVTWQNIDMDSLALDVVHFARMGLDMMQDNHLFPIPYKNNKTQKYGMNLMPGYNGIKYIADKYATEKPKDVTIELVYSTDVFKPIKKSLNNPIESYEFEITNAFERGEIKGGFGYIQYDDATKNKLITMSVKDILKRKPAYASSEFWGGKKTEWDNGKKKEVDVDGWFDEMCLKTIKREVYSAKHIPRDPAKIDENYQYLLRKEAKAAELEIAAEVDANANLDAIDISPSPEIDMETGEIVDVDPAPSPDAPEF